MYQNAAILAAFLLINSAVAGRIERSWIGEPIVARRTWEGRGLGKWAG